MADTSLRLIKRAAEFKSLAEASNVPRRRRGLYVLYRRRKKAGVEYYDVVYVGMARTGIRGRLLMHAKTKQREWTHFSAFEVWDNVRDDEIAELEGLLRHLYHRDSRANRLNKQRKYQKLHIVRQDDFAAWKEKEQHDQ